MEIGFGSFASLLDVLLVPISVGLLALLWPALSERRRRRNFEDLIVRELMEARPWVVEARSETTDDRPWPFYLDKRFLHEQIIGHPSENVEFVMSLDPVLAYSLSQTWIAFDKAGAQYLSESKISLERALQFEGSLKRVCQYLDRRRGSTLQALVYSEWLNLLRSKYPTATFSEDAVP